MKKFFIILFFVASIVTFYLIYQEYSFSPLKKSDFQKLFVKDSVDFNKSCSKDFLGVSTRGEYFEMYKYSIKNAVIDKRYPKLSEWENKKITDESIVGNWKNCPIDNQTMNLYKFTLTANDFDKIECCNSFNKEMYNSKNYYSFIHFSELEQYFLLYCVTNKELYYIRRKGF